MTAKSKPSEGAVQAYRALRDAPPLDIDAIGRIIDREAVAPAVRELTRALNAALGEWDRNTCIHEDTARGGIEWTICQQCGMKWSDRDGGFKPYEDPSRIAQARTTANKYRHLLDQPEEKP